MNANINPPELDMENIQVGDVFKPGTSVELVFNLDDMRPVVRSAMIYECNYIASQMTISQTQPLILPSYTYEQMNITALIHEALGQKLRTGLDCRIVTFMNDFRLTGEITEKAILIEYALPLKQINIRSAFRLQPNDRYEVEAILRWKGNAFQSGEDFKVANISFTGIGFLAPRRIGQKRNSLLAMASGTKATIEMHLVRKDASPGVVVISSVTTMVRVYPRFNPKSGYLGAKFSNLRIEDEEALSKFIHDAQLYEIRKANRTLEE